MVVQYEELEQHKLEQSEAPEMGEEHVCPEEQQVPPNWLQVLVVGEVVQATEQHVPEQSEKVPDFIELQVCVPACPRVR